MNRRTWRKRWIEIQDENVKLRKEELHHRKLEFSLIKYYKIKNGDK